MKQIFSIFQKDVRHHWIEIVLALVVLVAFSWNEPRQWAPRDFSQGRLRDILTGLLNVLVVISWWLLIVRVVQGEPLAGDRQFWITRPYEWKKLLVAKVLFIVVFVNSPLLIAGTFLLAKAGFAGTSFVTGGLWTQLTFVVVLTLPIMALATVTVSIAHLALALLAVGAYIAGVATLAAYVPSASFSSGSDALQAAVLIGACLAVVIWQYARRKTAKSRVLLVGTAALILVLVVATPYRALVAREYPNLASGSKLPVQLAFDPVKPPIPSVDPDRGKNVEIRIPLIVSGIAQGSSVAIDGTMLRIEAPDGRQWNSGWKSVNAFLPPERSRSQLDFEVEKDFFESTKSSAVRARVSFALTVFHERDTRRVIATAGDFAVPDVGLCSIEQEYSSSSVGCRFPLHVPRFSVKVASSETTCPAPEDLQVPQGKIARDWTGSTDADPFSLVGTTTIHFLKWEGIEGTDSETAPRICPGTPLVFSTQEPGQRIGFELEIDAINLPDYRVSDYFRFTVGARPKRSLN